MTQRYLRLLIFTIVLTLIAGYIVWPSSPGVHVGGINKDFTTRLGLDLKGGVQALLEAEYPEGQPPTAESMETAVRIFENRVNGLGVEEAVVQQAGTDRILVELPGESDPERAVATIKETGQLEFVDFSGIPVEQAYLLVGTTIQTDIQGTEPISPTQPVFHTIMTGANLETAVASADQLGEFLVQFTLDNEGARIFSDYTTQNVGNILAIVLDKEVISAPRISQPITEGSGSITGNFDLESANALAVQLRYGALPIPFRVIETRTVGPTLGQDSLQKSQTAGLIGFTIVILFMALYYRLPGVLADISILLYALFAFAIFRYIPVTLTLPGIAGFLLSTGSALDANILIFERLKEELRGGRTLRQSIDLGWRRAWPSIRDSNIATLITSGILFIFANNFGATIVKGFSITLALGVVISVFTAIVVTRVLFQLVFHYFTPSDNERWFGI